MSEIIGAPTLRGRYFGAMQSVFGLGAAIGPILGVTLWGHVGQGVWLRAVAVAVIAIACAQAGMRSPLLHAGT